MISRFNRLPLALSALLLTTASAAAACPASLAADFDRAVASKNMEAVQSAMNAISDNFACNEKLDDFRGKMIDFEIDLATNPSVPALEREKALKAATDNIAIGGTWHEAKKLGDYYESVKDDAHALAWYEKGISLLGMVPSTGANEKDLLELGQRAAVAKSLANNDGEGERKVAFVPSRAKTIDGKLDGIYSPLLRGVAVDKIPLPINFFTGETRFTPAGSAEVAELAQAVKEQDIHAFKLVGTCRPAREGSRQHGPIEAARGGRSGRAVKKGIQARITIEGKGDTEPYNVSLLRRPFSQDGTGNSIDGSNGFLVDEAK